MRSSSVLLLALALAAGCSPDSDGDGTPDREDCAPEDASIHPGATELCDDADVDEDCNGVADNEDAAATGQTAFVPDADGDGFGDANATATMACDAPPDFVTDATDCDDADAQTYPGASEANATLVDDPACDGGGASGSVAAADIVLTVEGLGTVYEHLPIASAGDVDGDGLDDVLVGAESYGLGAPGRAYLFLGSTLAATAGPMDVSLADYVFEAENGQDHAGGTVASAGDIDGDGLADIVIGADTADATDLGVGRAYVFFGSTLVSATETILSLADADRVISGVPSVSSVGKVVTSAGDVDGDGKSDLLVSATQWTPASALIPSAGLFLGSSLTSATSPELLITAADITLRSEVETPGLLHLSMAGDVDGDGLADLIVGDTSADTSGRGKAYLLLGASLSAWTEPTLGLDAADYSFTAEQDFARVGSSVSAAGDIDGDGLDDLLIGAEKAITESVDSGKAYVVLGNSLSAAPHGPFSLSDADIHLVSEEAYQDHVGRDVASAGDVDGDGLGDILVGAPFFSGTGDEMGKAYLLLGSTLATSVGSALNLGEADFGFVAVKDYDEVGNGLAAADFNGDGRSDLVLTGPYAGEVYFVRSGL